MLAGKHSQKGRNEWLQQVYRGYNTPASVRQGGFVPRQDERGPEAVGYTMREACCLARSVVPSQRIAACRLLGSVLAKELSVWWQKADQVHSLLLTKEHFIRRGSRML